jgi:hypothetical protein
VLLLGTPLASYAYTVTGSEVFSVDGHTEVFVLDYAFGHAKYALRMPLSAVRGTSPNDTPLSYEIYDMDGEPGNGTTYSIILSETSLHNGHYITPTGVRTPFRLLVLYQRAPEEMGVPLRLQVTRLPFAFIGVRELELNEHELGKYHVDTHAPSSRATMTVSPIRTH